MRSRRDGSHYARALQQPRQEDHLRDRHADYRQHLEDFVEHVELGGREDLLADLLLHQEVSLGDCQKGLL